MNLNDLRGSQRAVLREAIIRAFNPTTLDIFLQAAPLEKDPVHVLVRPGDFRAQVFDLVNLSQQEGWTDKLVVAIQATRSDNAKIKTLLSDLSIFDIEQADRTRLVAGSLERTVRERGGFADFVAWTATLTQLRDQVCRIEDPRDSRNALGTGFLVGPDLVITNYHVIDTYIDVADPTLGKIRDTRELKCRFDLAIETTGANPGITKPLAAPPEWLVDYAAYSAVDPGDRGGLPAQTELDYALIRLADQVGDAPGPRGAKRGWITVTSQPPALNEQDIVFIVQHPKGDPLKLSVGVALARNANNTRVRYDANTEGGSSGSPCFDVKLNLVALHHAGDPEWKRPAEFNQGIPMAPIIDQLRTRRVPQFWT
jgi:Trypsin-like peptidase domain/Effector-associated domain 1